MSIKAIYFEVPICCYIVPYAYGEIMKNGNGSGVFCGIN